MPLPPERSTLLSSFGYAMAGVRWGVASQRNMRIHLVLAVLAVIAAVILRLSATEWALLLLTITVVLAAELMNSAVEALVDLASPAYHPLAKVAKDTAAGAVLVTAVGAVGVGLALFLPHLWSLR